jgi:hypothetical protein
MKHLEFPEHGITLKEVPTGLSVSQHGESYIARNWHLDNYLVTLIDASIDAGFSCLIRTNHPRPNNRDSRGVEYLGFSRSPFERWAFVVDQYSCPNKKDRREIAKVTFEKSYRVALDRESIPWEPEPVGGQNLFVDFQHAIAAIHACASVVDLVEDTLGTREWQERQAAIGFINEYTLQSYLVKHWHELPFANHIEFLDREVPVEGGFVDILGRDRKTGRLVVIELKRGKPGAEVLDQVQRYVRSTKIRSLASGKQVAGLVIARNFFPSVFDALSTYDFAIGLFVFSESEGKIILRQVTRTSD